MAIIISSRLLLTRDKAPLLLFTWSLRRHFRNYYSFDLSLVLVSFHNMIDDNNNNNNNIIIIIINIILLFLGLVSSSASSPYLDIIRTCTHELN